MIWVDPDYRRYFNPQKLFSVMRQMQGEVYREGHGRVTLRFEQEGEGFFLKRHSGIGWREIFKDLLQGRLPIIGAINEWQALERLEIMNISSLIPVACGQQGWNPAKKQSFIITRELKDTVSLEDLVLKWQEREDFIHLKRKIIRQVATLARRMHAGGMNHRDLYICHLHVSRSWLDNPQGDPEIFVIDLHRAQIRRRVPQRWLVKDVASLYFSSMEAGLTFRDTLRFMRDYTGMSLRFLFNEQQEFWRDVQQRADRLYATRPGLENQLGDAP